jgi:NAD(P)-dependent dehydrogenase (short-subunit alcohol dehydrogenase family)
VTGDASVKKAVEKVLGTTGRIDVLVNNAGMGLLGGAEESSIEQAQALFDVNLFGLMRATNAVLPTMRDQKAGRIVNISSVLGLMLSAGERRSFTANTIIRNPDWRKKDAGGALNINPEDAKSIGVADGNRARLTTRGGSVEVLVNVSDQHAARPPLLAERTRPRFSRNGRPETLGWRWTQRAYPQRGSGLGRRHALAQEHARASGGSISASRRQEYSAASHE